jgi:hypothetical protein
MIILRGVVMQDSVAARRRDFKENGEGYNSSRIGHSSLFGIVARQHVN